MALWSCRYEEWWDLVSEQFDRDVSFALPMEPQQGDAMMLTTHDIRNEAGDAVWNQGEVRAGKAVAVSKLTLPYNFVNVRESTF